MKLIFNKKSKVLVEGSTKYFLKGEVYSMGKNLGAKYLENGSAEIFPRVKKVKVKKIKFIKTEKVEENGEN